MRLKRLTALLLALVMLALTGCHKEAKPDDKAPDTAAAGGEQTPAGTDGAEPTQEDEEPLDAYMEYLSLLLEKRGDILGYDWQKGLVFDEDYYETIPTAVGETVALVDVWGDDTLELIYLTGLDYDGYRYAAELHVCTFEDGAVRELLNDKTLDEQAGGGMNYRLFQNGDSKDLWLYCVYYSEGRNEVYTRFSSEGEMAPRLICEHSGYPDWNEEDPDDWYWVDEWTKNGKDCTEDTYNEAVPSEDAQAERLIMRNLYYYEYYDDIEPDQERYDFPRTGSSMTYDDAVAYLRGKLDIEMETEVDENEFFSQLLPQHFSFMSGAGAWSTDIFIKSDGSFVGEFYDANMGEDGEGYPYGTIYTCRFNGRFGAVKRIDEYTYSMHLLEIETEETEDEWIEDGVRYVASYPYGLENADEILVYMPGSWIRALPMEFITWVSMPRAWGSGDRPVLLPFCGLYNVNGEEGFSSYDYEYPAGSEVYVQWADDALRYYDEYDEFTADTAEPQSRIAIMTYSEVTDLKVLALSVEDVGENGYTFSTRELYTQDKLTPDRPLIVTMTFYGDSPCIGFSYTASDGAEYRYAVDMSGYDGSLYIIDF